MRHNDPGDQVRSYRRLKAHEIIKTAERLHRRIDDRFPASGLSNIAAELVLIARESIERAAWIVKLIIWLRVSVALLVVLIFALGGAIVNMLINDMRLNFAQSLAEALQGLESGVNELVFLSIAVFFLWTLEGRIKRARALNAIHELRSMAHIIDLHQLTKDPESVLQPSANPVDATTRSMTPQALSGYLDYCGELLSILSKIAAIHAEHLRDPVALSAVDEVETLVSGLTAKIWQKIMIIVLYRDTAAARGRSPGKSRKTVPRAKFR